jgi:hypothetical protein
MILIESKGYTIHWKAHGDVYCGYLNTLKSASGITYIQGIPIFRLLNSNDLIDNIYNEINREY